MVSPEEWQRRQEMIERFLDQHALEFVAAFIVFAKGYQWLSVVYKFLLRPGKRLRDYGEWAVVTGCTSGIGWAYALELARQGMNILLVSRDEQKLADAQRLLAERSPQVAVDRLQVDFSRFDAEARARVAEKLAPLDVGVLVNNVGHSYPFPRYFWELDDADVADVLGVNAGSVVWMTKIVLGEAGAPAQAGGMLARGRGVIVNTSSGGSRKSSPLLSEFSAAKAFVSNFSQSMNLELADRGILVQAQAPLYVASKASQAASLLVPSPETYVRYAVRHLGHKDEEIVPYWPQALLLWVSIYLPKWLLKRLTDNNEELRRDGYEQERAGRAAEERQKKTE